jgi:hypothetical protein
MSRRRRLAALVLLLAARPAAAGPPPPPLDELRERAGRYVADLEEKLAVVVGEESYRQALYLGRENSARARRSLDSDVAWVPTGDPMVWAFYRDVRSVGGEPVRDRTARLEALFPLGWADAARDRAQKILDESSRYNLGTRRTVNSPTVALTCLHPRNQARFTYRIAGSEERNGVPCWKVRFGEHRKPTLVRTSRGEDVPLRGILWIEAGRGAVVASRAEMTPPRLGPAVIETDYRFDERLGFWLPSEMQETYGNRVRGAGEDRVEAHARYSAWRRAAAQVEDIILPPAVKP